ncbi:hypothetical protein TBLA_0H01290 [Henningerozyma blattae CBS 6284]|uniref:Peptidase A1 domain-containing protein n=1 Tax=Henningerozyma blattae (strain ATCC 34711 / CBS 6284 / DSM 70876 / NBRC 10599 / NRRL Y-10934 / UCD 77-7) TaxID=1071380 RepID=I2H7R4_HENB6|nr:hypothetical protein TBLA_0H01290 [Tetrapisispora blattae CBS 6284]CCH62416.1 hypothetical protein TBLA_0H01290 [Tetrapisispora blattae CBS 6284]
MKDHAILLALLALINVSISDPIPPVENSNNDGKVNSVNSNFLKLGFEKFYADSINDIVIEYDNDTDDYRLQKRDSIIDLKESKPYVNLIKRNDGYEEIQIINQQSFYSVNLRIGTPAQSITVLVDTGSSDLWVTGSDNPYCKSNSGKSTNLLTPTDSDSDSDSDSQPDLESGSSSGNNDGDDGSILSWFEKFKFWKNNNKQEEVAKKNIVIIDDVLQIKNAQADSEKPDWNPFGWGSTATATTGGNSGYQTMSLDPSQATINCDTYGTFDIEDSSTFQSNKTSFAIRYADTSYATGEWGRDVLTFSDGLNVTGLSFAVANQTNSTVGVLGIGLPQLEVTYSGVYQSTKPYIYDNFPLVLKNSGAIHKSVYSLYLNKQNAKNGNVLFGAVDHSQYEGDTLYTVPLVNGDSSSGYSTPIEFDITLQGLGVTDNTNNYTVTTTQIVALLDSGTTLTYFPKDMLNLLAKTINASYSDALGYYVMNCPDSDDNTQIVFDFGGFHINANLTNFVLSSASGKCVLGLLPYNGNSAILGDMFLTHAYVVYNLDDLEISMAQANYDNSNEDIEVITSTVPNAVKAPGYSYTYSTSKSIVSGGNIFGSTTYSINPSSSNSGDSHDSTSTVQGTGSTSSRISTRTTSKTKQANDASNLFSPTNSLFTLLFTFICTLLV